MAKTGRTPAVINWDTVGQMLEADCKTVDIAAQLGISNDTLTRRCKRDLGVTFTVFSQQKRSRGDNLLRAAQFKAAMEGNTTMLIWLGKQRLNQSDKAELTGKGGAPLFPSKVIIGGDNGA
jgi:AraC-like DNA-binding protein